LLDIHCMYLKVHKCSNEWIEVGIKEVESTHISRLLVKPSYGLRKSKWAYIQKGLSDATVMLLETHLAHSHCHYLRFHRCFHQR
jgi:hypothetical protein